MNDILKVDRLTLRRGNFLLDDVSLSVSEQEIVALIGKTGAGKTVLLETIAGFNKPDRGSVLYQGREIASIPIERRNIGYCLKMQGCPRQEIRRQVLEMAERFGITGVLHQYPGTLSGGEQQRVALARALMMRPRSAFWTVGPAPHLNCRIHADNLHRWLFALPPVSLPILCLCKAHQRMYFSFWIFTSECSLRGLFLTLEQFPLTTNPVSKVLIAEIRKNFP